MDALLCRIVWLAGGMIGHMILTNTLPHTGRDVQPDFIQTALGAGGGAGRSRCSRSQGRPILPAKTIYGRPVWAYTPVLKSQSRGL
jgi:hypothetical protein